MSSNIESRCSAANLTLIPDVMLPSQLAHSGPETPYQRLAMAVLYDLVKHAVRLSEKVASGEKISSSMHKQALADLTWINEDRGPFPFHVCIELIAGKGAWESDAVEVWRNRLNAILSRYVIPKPKRLSRDSGTQSPHPTQIRVKR